MDKQKIILEGGSCQIDGHNHSLHSKNSSLALRPKNGTALLQEPNKGSLCSDCQFSHQDACPKGPFKIPFHSADVKTVTNKQLL